jgi:hypothetical protein
VKGLSASGGLTSDGEDVEGDLVMDHLGAPSGGPLVARTVVADIDSDPVAPVVGRESDRADGYGPRGRSQHCAACRPETVQLAYVTRPVARPYNVRRNVGGRRADGL